MVKRPVATGGTIWLLGQIGHHDWHHDNWNTLELHHHHHHHLLDHQQPAKQLWWIRRQNQEGWALIDTRPRLGKVLRLRNYSTDFWKKCVTFLYTNTNMKNNEKHWKPLYAILCLASFSPSAEKSGGFQGSAMVWSCSMLSPPRFTYWAKHIMTSWSTDSICINLYFMHPQSQTRLEIEGYEFTVTTHPLYQHPGNTGGLDLTLQSPLLYDFAHLRSYCTIMHHQHHPYRFSKKRDFQPQHWAIRLTLRLALAWWTIPLTSERHHEDSNKNPLACQHHLRSTHGIELSTNFESTRSKAESVWNLINLRLYHLSPSLT